MWVSELEQVITSKQESEGSKKERRGQQAREQRAASRRAEDSKQESREQQAGEQSQQTRKQRAYMLYTSWISGCTVTVAPTRAAKGWMVCMVRVMPLQ
jgi:hypothetical protein